MRRVEFGNNQSNQTISNTTDNSTIPIVYALGPPLATISSICIIIGTFFSLLCVYRYFRQANLRTHFTYIVSTTQGSSTTSTGTLPISSLVSFDVDLLPHFVVH